MSLEWEEVEFHSTPSFLLKDGNVSLQNVNVEGDAEFKGLTLGYSVKLSKDNGMTAVVNLK
jgi:hypothetical protein